jgi:SAM-dependent methyltransferase
MSFDAEAHRRASLDTWEDAASGWKARRGLIDAWSRPVSERMLEAVAPRPGERVLELAAGLGETGLLAARAVAPEGMVVISDQAEAMIEGARERAREQDVENVDFKVLNAEWIDLPLASVDVVLCRWGYMLMADPATALGETRRVLRPGGRLALAVWDAIEANPWAGLPAQELIERGLGAGPAASPGPFALGDLERVRELLERAGFTEARVEALDMARRHASFEELWDVTLDLSRSFHDAVLARPASEIEQIHDSLERRFEPYARADGTLEIPSRTLVASASA